MTNHKSIRIDAHAELDTLLQQVFDAINDETDPLGTMEHVFVRLIGVEHTWQVELLGTEEALFVVLTEVWGMPFDEAEEFVNLNGQVVA